MYLPQQNVLKLSPLCNSGYYSLTFVVTDGYYSMAPAQELLIHVLENQPAVLSSTQQLPLQKTIDVTHYGYLLDRTLAFVDAERN